MKKTKIKLVKRLGDIIVREYYSHEKRLKIFREEEQKNFLMIHTLLTDENFSSPTDVLKPGDKLHPFVYQIIDNITIREHLKTLRSFSEAVFPGPQGVSLIDRNELDEGSYYLFDKGETFGEIDGDIRIPNLNIDEDRKAAFGLGFLEMSFFDFVSEKKLFFFLFLKENFKIPEVLAFLER